MFSISVYVSSQVRTSVSGKDSYGLMFQALLLEPSAGNVSNLNALRSLLPRCLLASVLFSAPGWFSRTTSKVVSDLAGPLVSCGVHRALQKDVVGSTSLPAECVRCTKFPHAHSF